MKTVLYLLGLMRDHYTDRAKETRRIEERWRAEFKEFEDALPDPAERTIEQWEELVNLTGELYYAMAAHSNTYAASNHINQLYDAVEEQAK